MVANPIQVEEAVTILVADDEPTNRSLIQRRLERAGYLVLTAENGRRAVELTQAEMPDMCRSASPIRASVLTSPPSRKSSTNFVRPIIQTRAHTAAAVSDSPSPSDSSNDSVATSARHQSQAMAQPSGSASRRKSLEQMHEN